MVHIDIPIPIPRKKELLVLILIKTSVKPIIARIKFNVIAKLTPPNSSFYQASRHLPQS